MIDLRKIEYNFIELSPSDEVSCHGKLILQEFGNFRHSELLRKTRSEFLVKMREVIEERIWEGAYHELRDPIKRLQALALQYAKESPEVEAVRELCRQLDDLLKKPTL